MAKVEAMDKKEIQKCENWIFRQNTTMSLPKVCPVASKTDDGVTFNETYGYTNGEGVAGWSKACSMNRF